MTVDEKKEKQSDKRQTPMRRFDYACVEPSVANFLKGEAERLRRHYSGSIIQVGKALVGTKRYLQHGAFIEWVEFEAGIPARTAQAYMRVAKWVSGKSAIVAHLPPSILYLLSAPSTPEQFSHDVVDRADAGEKVTLGTVRRELRALRNAKEDFSTEALNDESREMGEEQGDVSGLLSQAVAIVARELCPASLEKFYKLMTERQVLEDPNLAQKIASCLSIVRSVTESRRKLGRRSLGSGSVEVHANDKANDEFVLGEPSVAVVIGNGHGVQRRARGGQSLASR
jgi:hypothetical protein